jgi:hypothetical protein
MLDPTVPVAPCSSSPAYYERQATIPFNSMENKQLFSCTVPFYWALRLLLYQLFRSPSLIGGDYEANFD